MIIQNRRKILINTDPQKRCYNGAYASYEMQWSAWETLEVGPFKDVDIRLQFWRELNDYAVSKRGKCARQEFRLFPMNCLINS